jgi:DNA repair protein RadA/Sms
MAKDKEYHKCSSCGYISTKWLGKCPECGSWNSFEKFIESKNPNAEQFKAKDISQGQSLKPASFSEIINNLKNQTKNRIYPFSANLLNNFFGSGGLVSSSLTLMAGEPGIGKSTFSLQILRALFNGSEVNKPNLMYITAEESIQELALRAKRLEIPQSITCFQANNFEKIEKVILENKPDVVIIDSIQTIYSPNINSNPGSVSQVSTLTNQFLAIAKSNNIAIILIGHVTKEGQIAGPKTLEHMVDSVLILEQSENPIFRTLSFTKHRFGSIENLLLLKMETNGLQIITDPSLVLLENIEQGIGIVYGMGIAKNLPFVVEIQALVNNKYEKKSNNDDETNTEKISFGRRESVGIKLSKLNIILAIIEKYLGISLKNKDVYVSVHGLPKNFEDDSLDLPILLSILSSMKNQNLENLNVEQLLSGGIDFEKNYFNKSQSKKQAFAGRLTLSGKLRQATNLELRKKTAKNLGFSLN